VAPLDAVNASAAEVDGAPVARRVGHGIILGVVVQHGAKLFEVQLAGVVGVVRVQEVLQIVAGRVQAELLERQLQLQRR
jgi:hypothetical protein